MITPIAAKKQFEIKSAGELTGNINEALESNQYRFLWTYVVNIILALWLITSPHLYDYKSAGLAQSDTIAGLLIILFECLSFAPKRAVLRWCTPAVAFWLFMAPLIFWSPSAAVYLLDTLIGSFLIVFSILIPGLPASAPIDLPGPDQPPGWSYNPSSWIRRWLGIGLALAGFFISRYLSAHQLGYIPHAFDPFFGNGSDKVLTSSVSRSFPISDAGFGCVAYMMEVLIGFAGGRARWRTAPWAVILFAIVVLPLGITSIVLVITQPIVVGAWCGLCLIAACALMTSVPLSVHEFIAVGQFLRAAYLQKRKFWQVFWQGGSIVDGGAKDPDRKNYSLAKRWIASIQGVTIPWTIAAQLAIGCWLMARPDIAGRSADCDHLLGAMVVTVAAIATAEVTRIVRFANIPLGILLIVAAVLFATNQLPVLMSEIICGLALAALAIPKGEIIERYAGWDKFVK